MRWLVSSISNERHQRTGNDYRNLRGGKGYAAQDKGAKDSLQAPEHAVSVEDHQIPNEREQPEKWERKVCHAGAARPKQPQQAKKQNKIPRNIGNKDQRKDSNGPHIHS